MKMWSGRFEGELNKAADAFNSSLAFDKRLALFDIEGSIAHVKMLAKQKIIPEGDAAVCLEALEELLQQAEMDLSVIDGDYEDIHMAVEAVLTERIGLAAKRIHTARSRNDQVALDMRMYAREAVMDLIARLETLINTLCNIALANTETLMPGYTHLQRAQPVTLAHWLAAYIEMFLRDTERLNETYRRINVMPLGSGALAASTFPIDREYVAELLKFDRITQNSIDGVSDRDYLIEVIFEASLIMMHLSRFCEEIIIFSTTEFSFITLPDAYSTGSSMMPQKKNPDMAELIRGKTGRVYGSLMTILTVMKGIPLAYDKDMQEDKEAAFDALDTASNCLLVFTGMADALIFNKETMRNASGQSFMNATDLAEYLVKKGCAFRDAHFISGSLVKLCSQKGCALSELTIDELRAESLLFEEDVYAVLSPETSIMAKTAEGSPNPGIVASYLKNIQNKIANTVKNE